MRSSMSDQSFARTSHMERLVAVGEFLMTPLKFFLWIQAIVCGYIFYVKAAQIRSNWFPMGVSDPYAEVIRLMAFTVIVFPVGPLHSLSITTLFIPSSPSDLFAWYAVAFV